MPDRTMAPHPRDDSWYFQDARGYQSSSGNSGSAFHRRLPGYQTTPLLSQPEIAADLGLGAIWVKDESSRLGLPSFKILGASWASYRALRDLGGFSDEDWSTVEELARLVQETTQVRQLAAATDGNHGRAVARMARWLGMAAAVYVPLGTAAARIDAIRSEGATVTVVPGGYGDAIRQSADDASRECLVVSDTSWRGYETVPTFVIEGYSTIFEEVEVQLRSADVPQCDLVVVQVGVGALAGAAVRHYRSRGRERRPRLVSVEPIGSECILRSVQAGERATIPGPHPSIMVGLNCDTPSLVAWPDVQHGMDLFLAVDDDAARRAMRSLANVGMAVGETGAAGLAGLTAICEAADQQWRDAVGLGQDASVLLICTEGPTDAGAYADILGI